jgi:hypothetical protein
MNDDSSPCVIDCGTGTSFRCYVRTARCLSSNTQCLLFLKKWNHHHGLKDDGLIELKPSNLRATTPRLPKETKLAIHYSTIEDPCAINTGRNELMRMTSSGCNLLDVLVKEYWRHDNNQPQQHGQDLILSIRHSTQ